MDRLLSLLAILMFAVAASFAAEPAGEEYWNKVLPNTPMPRAIKDLLAVASDGKTGTVVNVGKGGVNVNTGKPQPGGTHVNVGKGGVGVNTGGGTHVNVGGGGVGVNTGGNGKGTHVNVGKGGVGVNTGGGTHVNVGGGGVGVNTGKGTHVNVGKGGVGVNTGGGTHVNVGGGGVGVNTGKGTHVNVGKGGVGVNTGGKGKPGGTTVNVGKGGVSVGVTTPPKKKPVYVHASPFNYLYAATETQVRDDPTVALFFTEKDLTPGTKLTLDFSAPATRAAAFIPRREADSIPFASARLPEILARLSVDPASDEAERMRQTLAECERPAMRGERRRCATSLESMVEFSTASLGTRDVVAVSTTVGGAGSPPKQEYTVGRVRKMAGERKVVCHAEEYAYAVFYCHAAERSRGYGVEMVGADGTRVEAVAVCHTDTAGWNPKHVAFQVLGVRPGTVPVCHFLPQDHLVWGPSK